MPARKHPFAAERWKYRLRAAAFARIARLVPGEG